MDVLARALELTGHDAWFDRALDAGPFRDQIEEKLDQADVAIVVWSARSRKSRYVIDESERAAARGILLPVRIDQAELPLGFGGLQTFDLSSWSGRADDEKLRTVLVQIERIAKRPSVPIERPAIAVISRSLLLACCVAAFFGPVLALLGALKQNSPASAVSLSDVAEGFAIALAGTAPVMLWSGFEISRFGLSHGALILRRAGAVFGIAASAALALAAAAAAAGVARNLSPAAALAQLGFVVIVATLALGALISFGKALRRLLGAISFRG